MGLRRNAQRFGGFKPTNLSGCVLWLRADALALNDGDPVGAWSDESGAGNDLTQASAPAKPTLDTDQQNGLPGVYFDEIDDNIGNSTFAVASVVSVLVVGRWIDTSDDFEMLYLFGTQGGNAPNVAFMKGGLTGDGNKAGQGTFNAGDIRGWTGTLASFHSYVTHHVAGDGAAFRIWTDGVEPSTYATSGTPGNNAWGAGFYLGHSVNLFNGYICEVAAYNRELTDAERSSLASYARSKWGTP